MVSLLHCIIPYWIIVRRAHVIRVKDSGMDLARFFQYGGPKLYAFLFKIDV